MKKISLLFTAMIMMCGVAMAQTPVQTPVRTSMEMQMTPEQMTEQMVRDYTLTTAQRERVHQLNMDMSRRMSDIRAVDNAARNREMQTIRNDYDRGLKNVLTNDQYKRYTKAEKERKKNMKNNMRNR